MSCDARPSASLLWNVVATLIRLKDCVTLRFLGQCFPPIQLGRPLELSQGVSYLRLMVRFMLKCCCLRGRACALLLLRSGDLIRLFAFLPFSRLKTYCQIFCTMHPLLKLFSLTRGTKLSSRIQLIQIDCRARFSYAPLVASE